MLFFTSIQVSVFSLVVTAVNHYLALCKSLKKQLISKQMNLFVLLGVWILVIFTAMFSGKFHNTEIATPLCLLFASDRLVDAILNAFILADFVALITVCYLYKQTETAIKTSSEYFREQGKKKLTPFTHKILLALLSNILMILCYSTIAFVFHVFGDPIDNMYILTLELWCCIQCLFQSNSAYISDNKVSAFTMHTEKITLIEAHIESFQTYMNMKDQPKTTAN